MGVTGTLGVTGATSLSTVSTSGLAQLSSVSVTGNSTLGTTGVTTNIFGNTTGVGTTNTLYGRTILDGANQTTANLLTVQNVPNAAASWGISVTAATGTANPSQGIFATATSNALDNANAGRFDAEGAGITNTGVTINVGDVTSATNNTGESITVRGTNRFGAKIDMVGAGTGIVVNNAALGIDIPGPGGSLPATSTALNVKLTPTLNQVGLTVDMNTGVSGALGVNINNVAAAKAVSVAGSTITSGAGISVLGMTSGTGVEVANTGSVGISSSAASAGSASAIAIQATGDATGSTYKGTALEIVAGNVKSTGSGDGRLATASNRWADTYTLSPALPNDHAANFLRIYNGLVKSNSTIIITVDGSTAAPLGQTVVDNDAADGTGFNTGHFNVYTTSASFGAGVYAIHYMIINH
jgi:hypothetical protein